MVQHLEYERAQEFSIEKKIYKNVKLACVCFIRCTKKVTRTRVMQEKIFKKGFRFNSGCYVFVKVKSLKVFLHLVYKHKYLRSRNP